MKLGEEDENMRRNETKNINLTFVVDLVVYRYHGESLVT